MKDLFLSYQGLSPLLRAAQQILPILVIYLFFLFFQIHPTLVNPDGIGYYAYVRSLFLDRDLNLLNEFKALNIISPFIYRTSTDLVGNQYPIGSAVLWTPFFLLSHLYTWLSPYFYPVPLNPDGYSAFYFISLALGTSFYGTLGLFLVHEVGKQLFPSKTIGLATSLIVFGTPFFYYLFVQPTLAHINSFFTLSLFLYVWFFTRNNRTLGQWALLGLTAGLMGLVRTQNLLFVLLPFLELSMVRGPWSVAFNQGQQTINNGQQTTGKIAVFLGAMMFALTPQMLVWKALYGTPISPIHGVLNLNFREWHLLKLLFSPFHGLFFWSPLLLFTLPGFYVLARKDFLLGTAFFIFLSLQVFLNSWTLYWWGGYSFGSRFFVDYTFLFILSLAGFIHWLILPFLHPLKIPSPTLPLLAFCLLGGLGLWNFLLFLQTMLHNLDLNRYIPLQVLLQGQLWALKNLIPAGAQIFLSPKLPGKVLLYLAPMLLFIALTLLISCQLLAVSGNRQRTLRLSSEPVLNLSKEQATDNGPWTRILSGLLGFYLLSFVLWLSVAYINTDPLTNRTEVSRTVEDFKIFLQTQSRLVYEDYLQK